MKIVIKTISLIGFVFGIVIFFFLILWDDLTESD